MSLPKPVTIKSAEGKGKGAPPKTISVKPIAVKPVPVAGGKVKPVSVKPVGIKPVSAQPVAVKPVSAKPVAVKPVSGGKGQVKPVAVKPVGAVQPISVKPVSVKGQAPSPASNLAGTLSNIGAKKGAPSESQISVRPVSAASPGGAPHASFDASAELPDSKSDLYSELIALEGRRFAVERRRKEVDDQYEKGQLAQVEYRSTASRADADLQAIASRINAIRQKLSSM
jgi:hypothetical protein